MILFKEQNLLIIIIVQMAIIKTLNCACNSQANMKIVIISKLGNVTIKIKKESSVNKTLQNLQIFFKL